MPESAFKDTVLEGRERKYTVLNEHDIQKYSSTKWIDNMNHAINDVLNDVQAGRVHDGKKPYNSYIVINVDEPYVNDVIRIMHRNGQWEGELEIFQVEDIDGCEFIKSNVIGRMMISYHQDFDGYYTGKIHVVYPDGSHALISYEEAQEKFDSGEWTVIR